MALGLFSVVFATALVMTNSAETAAPAPFVVDAARARDRLISSELSLAGKPGLVSLAKFAEYRERFPGLAYHAPEREAWADFLADIGVDPSASASVVTHPTFTIYEGGRVPALSGARVAYYTSLNLGEPADSERRELSELGLRFVNAPSGPLRLDGDVYIGAESSRLPLRLAGFDGQMDAVVANAWQVIDPRDYPHVPCIPITNVPDAHKVTCSSAAWSSMPCTAANGYPADPFGRAWSQIADFNATVPARVLTASKVTSTVQNGCSTNSYKYSIGTDSVRVGSFDLSGTGALVEGADAPRLTVALTLYLNVSSDRVNSDYLSLQVCRRSGTITCADNDAAWETPAGLNITRKDWDHSLGRCYSNQVQLRYRPCTITMTVPPSALDTLVDLRLLWTATSLPSWQSVEHPGGVFIQDMSVAVEKASAPARAAGACSPHASRSYLYCNLLDYATTHYDALVVGSSSSESSLLSNVATRSALLRWAEQGGSLIQLGARHEAYDAFWRVFGVLDWKLSADCASSQETPTFGEIVSRRPMGEEPLLSVPFSLPDLYRYDSDDMSNFHPTDWVGECGSTAARDPAVGRLGHALWIQVNVDPRQGSGSSSSSSGGGGGSGCLMAHSAEGGGQRLEPHRVTNMCRYTLQAAALGSYEFPILSHMTRAPHSGFSGCFIATSLKPGAFNWGAGDGTAQFLSNLLLRCLYSEAYSEFGDARPLESTLGVRASAFALACDADGTNCVRARIVFEAW